MAVLNADVFPRHRVGDSAKNAFHANPSNTVFDAKRLIGRKMSETELKEDIKHWLVRDSFICVFDEISTVTIEDLLFFRPFKVVDKSNKPLVSVGYKGEQQEFVSFSL